MPVSGNDPPPQETPPAPRSGVRSAAARGAVVGLVFGALLPLPHLLFAGTAITAPFGGLVVLGDGAARAAALGAAAVTLAVVAGATSHVEWLGRGRRARRAAASAVNGVVFAAGVLLAALQAAFAYASIEGASPRAGYTAALSLAREHGPVLLVQLLAPTWLAFAIVTLARLGRWSTGAQAALALGVTLGATPFGALASGERGPHGRGFHLPPPGFGVAMLVALVAPVLLRAAEGGGGAPRGAER